ncbi:MAG: sensor histidine kinase [Chitinophagaceae bacterium]
MAFFLLPFHFIPIVKKLFLFIVICHLVFTSVCKASPEAPALSFQKVQYKAGRMLFDTYQDSQGYIWIASANGVARYNGGRFTHYSKNDGLSDLNVFSFYEDSRQRIWAVTFNGAPCFFSNGKWHNQDNTPWLRQMAGNGPIQSILEHGGKVVVACARKVFFIQGEAIIRSIAIKSLLPYAEKLAGAIRFNGKLLMVTDAGFYLPEERRFIMLPKNIRFLNQNTKMVVWKNMLWISHDRQLHVFKTSLRLEKKLRVPGNDLVVNILLPSQEGQGKNMPQPIAVCTEHAVFTLSTTGEISFKQVVKDIPWISSLRKDRAGNTWATSLTSGLFLAEPEPFRRVQFTGATPEDICSRLEVINGKLWAGTENGCIFTESDGAQINNTNSLRFVHAARFSESFKRVRNFQLHRNHLYAALDGRLLVIDPATLTTVSVPGATKALIVLKDDSLLVARSAKLIKMPLPDVSLPVQPANGYPEREILREKALCLTPSGNDSTWVGCWEGVRLLVKDQNISVPAALRHIRSPVTAIVPLPGKKLLIGTREEGLIHFDGSAIKYLRDSGRSGYWVHQIVAANEPGKWWVATNTGISLVAFANSEPIIENRYGIPYEGAVLSIALHRGKLWLATESGVYTLPLSQKTIPGPKVYWEEVQLKDTVHPLRFSNTSPERIRLGNSFTLRFTPFYFSTLYKPVFRYKITPGNEDWERTGSPEIQFRQLAPGNYTVEVQARSPYTAFSPSALLNIYIAPPWWATWWFRTFAIIAALGMVTLFFRNKIRRLRQKNDMEQQRIVREKENVTLQHQLLQWQQEAEKAQLTPHFIFNAIYALQGYYGAGKILEGKAYAEKFSGLIREQLRLSGKERLALGEEMQLLKNFCAWRNMKKKYPVEIDFEYDKHQLMSLHIPAMLLQPLIENCFDHGFENDAPGQRIHMNIHPEPSKELLQIEITDNGKGYVPNILLHESEGTNTPKEPSNGKGVALVSKRLQLLGKLAWKNRQLPEPLFEITRLNEAGGCKVVLKIPCSFEGHESL